MPEYHPSQDKLDIMAIIIEKPEFTGTSIRVSVRDLGVWEGFPGYSEDVFYARAVLVYEGVVQSIRKVFEYSDGSSEKGSFKSEYTIEDGPFDSNDLETSRYFLEGILETPHAWIDWEITAASLHIEEGIPKKNLRNVK